MRPEYVYEAYMTGGHTFSPRIAYKEYRVVKRTRCGFWLREEYGDFTIYGEDYKFWRSSALHSRSAWRYCATKEEAAEGLRKRLSYKIRQTEKRISTWKYELQALERIINERKSA